MSTSIINHLTWFQDINLAAAKSTLISRNQVYLQCILPPRVHLQWLIHSQGAVMHMPVNKPNVNCTYDSSHGTDEIYPKGPPTYIYIHTYILYIYSIYIYTIQLECCTRIHCIRMPDSGHDRAQRGQNPGITQNRAVARFWRHIFAWIVKSANSTSLPCLILLQIVQMPAIQY